MRQRPAGTPAGLCRRGARQGGEGTHAVTQSLSGARCSAGRVQAGLAGSPSVTGVTSPPVGENPHVARTSPFRERCPAGRRGNPRDHIELVCGALQCGTRSGCTCRFPLCHWRDISPGGGESLIARTSPFRERCPAGRRGNPRDHRRSCGAVRGRVQAALAGSPSVTGVTSPPKGENARVARTSPFRERCPAGRRGNPRDYIELVCRERNPGVQWSVSRPGTERRAWPAKSKVGSMSQLNARPWREARIT